MKKINFPFLIKHLNLNKFINYLNKNQTNFSEEKIIYHDFLKSCEVKGYRYEKLRDELFDTDLYYEIDERLISYSAWEMDKERSFFDAMSENFSTVDAFFAEETRTKKNKDIYDFNESKDYGKLEFNYRLIQSILDKKYYLIVMYYGRPNKVGFQAMGNYCRKIFNNKNEGIKFAEKEIKFIKKNEFNLEMLKKSN